MKSWPTKDPMNFARVFAGAGKFFGRKPSDFFVKARFCLRPGTCFERLGRARDVKIAARAVGEGLPSESCGSIKCSSPTTKNVRTG